MIRNIVGAAVTAEDFFGREKEIKQGLNKLKNGNSLMLSAPRRVGKTSFSKKMIELLEKEGWIGIFIDMEHLKTELELYKELANKLNEKRETLPRITNNVKHALSDLSVSFKEFGLKIGSAFDRQALRKDVLKVINNKEHPINLLFVFDELAVFLNNVTNDGADPDKAKDFLNSLRSIRQESEGRALWIFCSSISIENYLFQYNLTASMNDTLDFHIGEMPEQEAYGLLKELAEGAHITIPEGTQEYILKRLGLALPYNIQGLFSEIVDNVEDNVVVTNKDVDNAYHQLISNSPHMKTWYERLNDYGNTGLELKIILRFLCQQPEPVSIDRIFDSAFSSHEESDLEHLRTLIQLLIHDGYIIPDNDNKLTFRMNLLKDYWKYYNL